MLSWNPYPKVWQFLTIWYAHLSPWNTQHTNVWSKPSIDIKPYAYNKHMETVHILVYIVGDVCTHNLLIQFEMDYADHIKYTNGLISFIYCFSNVHSAFLWESLLIFVIVASITDLYLYRSLLQLYEGYQIIHDDDTSASQRILNGTWVQ